jgi:hypothetical protein
MRKTTLSIIIFIAAAIFILQSCYPGDELTYSDTDIVATFYDKNADFSNYNTYIMSDTIYTFDDENQSLIPANDVSPANKTAILNGIESNLKDIGFDSTSNPSEANVVIAVIVTSSTWVSGGCYYGYWSYWYPYYGWCYPVYYTYDTGTIIIAMIDKSVAEERPGLWIATINGLLGDTNAELQSRINKNIDQAFSQSPYLGEGK